MSSTRYFDLRGAGAAGRFVLVRLETTLLRLIRFILVSEVAGNASPPLFGGGHVQFAADAPRPVVHDAQAKALHLQLRWQAGAVISDVQFNFVVTKFQAHSDAFRLAMLDGIIDCFLSDSENVRR